MTPHILMANENGLDMIATVHSGFFRCMSASGPIAPMFTDQGPAQVGAGLTLGYDYDTDEYASRTGGWDCTIKHINRKTVTVTSDATGRDHRIEF